MKHELIALIDMDGTVADFDGQMQQDLDAMRAPSEGPYVAAPGDHPPHIEARMRVIKRQPGWWRNLPVYPLGMTIVSLLRRHGFRLNILTKGPFKTTAAWSEKVGWCREHMADASVTITEDKGLVYGKVLVDDWPDYIMRWLEWRPRGLVIMPAHPWNDDFEHPNVIRFDGGHEQLLKIESRIRAIEKAASREEDE